MNNDDWILKNENIKDLIYYNSKKEEKNIKDANIYIKTTNFSSMFRSPNTNLNPVSAAGKPTTWSPMSKAGLVYEWDRGVIGIAENGEVIKINLDGTTRHHADATIEIGQRLNFKVNEGERLPFAVALEVIRNGAIVIQSEGTNCFVYLPGNVTETQIRLLFEQIAPRMNFEFSFVHGENVYEEQSVENIMAFANSIKKDQNYGFGR